MYIRIILIQLVFNFFLKIVYIILYTNFISKINLTERIKISLAKKFMYVHVHMYIIDGNKICWIYEGIFHTC